MISSIVFMGILTALIVAIVSSIRFMKAVTFLHALTITVVFGYTLLATSLPVFFVGDLFLWDTLAVYEILISAVIFLLASIYAIGYVDSLIKMGELNPKNVKFFYVIFNLLLLSVVLAFSANNLALLWIFAELTTLFSAILIVLLNAKENITAAIKYVFIASTAMIFSFMGMIFLVAASQQNIGISTLNWDLLLQNAKLLPPQLFVLSFILIFIGFAAKSGIVPFHTWLPPAYSKAPSIVNVLLSGSISNIGIYALIRMYAVAAQTSAKTFLSAILLIFGVISIGIAALSMVKRTNLKKLIAFSSIEHQGIMLVGISVGAVFWVLAYIAAHTLAKTLLFFSAGVLHRQYRGVKSEFIHDIFSYQPLASWGLVAGSAAIIGLPLFPLFLPKFFILAKLGAFSSILLFVVLIFLLIVAGSISWFIINLAKPRGKNIALYETPLSMKITLWLLIIFIIGLGVYFPEKLQAILRIAVQQLGL